MSIQNFRDVPRVYFDLDGPLGDYFRLAEFTGHGDDPSSMKLVRGAYENLPVTHNAVLALTEIYKLREFCDMFICSKIPTSNVHSATEKYWWIHNMLPGVFGNRVILTPDKACVGSERDLIIDDHPLWANLPKFPGRVIQWERVSDTENNWCDCISQVYQHLHGYWYERSILNMTKAHRLSAKMNGFHSRYKKGFPK